jgi:hypothetical protein
VRRHNHSTLPQLTEEVLRRVLNNLRDNAKPAFKLEDASVLGQAMLVSESRDWHHMELEHISTRTFDAAK